MEYQRPELTKEEAQKISVRAHLISRDHNYIARTSRIAALMIENVKLLKEIQDHRAARGIDPLPGFEIVKD